MKAELTFSPETIKEIALEVAELLRPFLINSSGGEEDDLLNTAEVAKFLKVSEGQIYQWTNKSKHSLGDFPYYKTGKQLRFSKKELKQWLKSRKNS